MTPTKEYAGSESGGADDRKDQADELGELQRRHRFALLDRSQPGRDQGGEHPPVGVPARPADGADGKDRRLARPKMTAAASGLTADTISAITRTAVVTQAANLGPRTSTRSALAVVVVLLLDTEATPRYSCCTERWRHATVGSEAAPSACAEGRGYSAATATTTTRDAAQIDCAALGEHGLKAG